MNFYIGILQKYKLILFLCYKIQILNIFNSIGEKNTNFSLQKVP